MSQEEANELCEDDLRAVRLGHGANCSSVGSVIDTLFIGAAVGGAIFAAVCAAMKTEGVTVVGAGAPGAAGASLATEPDASNDDDANDASDDEGERS